MDLSERLAELLHDNDCAVIPGFGGFVARYRPAQMHPIEHVLKPPSKSVGFNPSLKANDGMLLNALISKGYSAEEARELITRYAEACSEKLGSDKSLIFPKLGRLVMDSGGTVRFIQDEHTNLLRSSFGLKPVQLSPVMRRVPVRSGADDLRQRKPKRIRALIAAASVVGIVATATSLYFLNDSIHQQVSGFFQNIVAKEEADLKVSLPLPDEASMRTDWTGLRALGCEVRLPLEHEATSSEPAAYTVHPGTYYVIVGAFSSEANAQRQLERASTIYRHVSAFKSNGLNQVGVYASADEGEANRILSEVRANFEPTAWLTRR